MSSNSNAPTDALARVEEEIHHQKALLSKQIVFLSNLHVKRNSLLPVFRLPPETLAIIFIHGARDYYESNAGGYFTPYIPTWVNVSYVCHHWRNIALDCSTLWTYPFHISLRWTEELLLRSKQALLKISCISTYAWIAKNDQWLGLLDMFLKHSERIQELRLHLLPSFVPANFTFSAPHLEKLEIEFSQGHSVWPLVITDGDKSPLRILKLVDCSLPWCSLNLGGLKTLSLCRVHSPSPPNMLQFLTILSGMRDLTVLHLEDALPSAHGFLSSGGLGISPKVNLPHLTRLVIVAPVSMVVALLSCVNIPLKTQLRLEPQFERGWRSIDDYHPIVSFIAQRFSISEEQSSSDPIRSLIIDSTPKMTFRTSERDCEPRNPRSFEDDTSLEVILGRNKTENEDLMHSHKYCIMSDIRCSLPLTNVQSLHIIRPMPSSAIWKEILGHLDGLRYMKLSRGRMPDLCFLSLTVPGPKENLTEQLPHDQGHIFLPALEELELYRITFTPEWEVYGMSEKSFLNALCTRKGLRDRLIMIECTPDSVEIRD